MSDSLLGFVVAIMVGGFTGWCLQPWLSDCIERYFDRRRARKSGEEYTFKTYDGREL